MDYIIPGFLGFLVGAVIFGLTYQSVFPPIAAIAKMGNVVMPDLWNINSFLIILLFALITLLLFYLIDRMGWQRTPHDPVSNPITPQEPVRYPREK